VSPGLLDFVVPGDDESADRPVLGVAVGVVTNSADLLGLGRVQVRLPWMPGYEPWARLATPSAGRGRGIYAIPQTGDEVVLAFHQGDVNEPIVIGSLWNNVDRPPFGTLTDPEDKRAIRTPAGHRLVFSDLEQSITVTHAGGHTVTVSAGSIELETSESTAKLMLSASGAITIEANTDLTLKATSISLEATTIDITSDASTSIDGGASCQVQAGVIQLN
jgi:uncharacterized protein involved in type VI secretion and phage assembly